jgi:hypothetical protein
MKKSKKSEESMQIAVSEYLKLQYPSVVFTSESSGIRLTMGQAKKAMRMRSKDKLPDMIILEPRGCYTGLCLELKKEGTTVFKRDGEPYAGQIAEQYKTLQKLGRKGYYTRFAVGFDNAKQIIDNYMTKEVYDGIR